MRKMLALIVMMSFVPSVFAEFFDPMRPPTFALNKLRLEKASKTDPGKTIQSSAKKEPLWVLSSILYSKERKHAIINNKLVRTGDLIKGARIVRLQPDSVRLLANGITINLSLGSRNKSIRKSRSKRKL